MFLEIRNNSRKLEMENVPLVKEMKQKLVNQEKKKARMSRIRKEQARMVNKKIKQDQEICVQTSHQ